MKKLYASILGLIAGTAGLMAQETTTFAFEYNGTAVPNGSVINVATVETINLGDLKIYKMEINLKLRNVSEDPCPVSLVCEGKENYNLVQFCPNGNCLSWGDPAVLSTYYNSVAAGQLADNANWLHVEHPTAETSFSYDGTVLLKAYPPLDDEDCATVTIHFNTAGTDGIQSLGNLCNDQKVEVFNLCGRKVADTTAGLSKGIYIIRQGGVSRKVTVK